jgi:hypothetical protein
MNGVEDMEEYPGVEATIDSLEGHVRRLEASNTELGLANDKYRILKRLADELVDNVIELGYSDLVRKYIDFRDSK